MAARRDDRGSRVRALGRGRLAAACAAAVWGAACSSASVASPRAAAPAPTPSTTSGPSTSSTTSTTSTTVPSAPSGGPWRLAFDDEFDGSRLDASAWATCYYWSSTTCTNSTTAELELYEPANVGVRAGVLRLTAKRQAASAGGHVFAYTSGIVSGMSPAGALFSFEHGFVDARVRVPAGAGLWSALWMLPVDGSPLPEVDIFEVYGRHPRIAHQTTHWAAFGNAHQSGHSTRGPDLSAGWHDFGLDWEGTRLVWLVDGKVVWTVRGASMVPRTRMYLLADLAVGGTFGGPPTASTPFPSSLELDYVRVWKRA